MLFGYSKRDVGFLMAAKSFNRMVVGQFAKLMNAIAVVRPGDIAKKGCAIVVFERCTRSYAVMQGGEHKTNTCIILRMHILSEAVCCIAKGALVCQLATPNVCIVRHRHVEGDEWHYVDRRRHKIHQTGICHVSQSLMISGYMLELGTSSLMGMSHHHARKLSFRSWAI